MPTLPKHHRLKIFYARLLNREPFSSREEAYTALSSTLIAIEDEFSGIPNNPSTWQTDGRLYPPQQDTKRSVPGAPGIVRYRSLAHNTLIGENGSIRIETIAGEILLNKPGADGRTVADIERGGLTMQDAKEYALYAMDEQFRRFQQLIEQRLIGAVIEVDESASLAGRCWIDIHFEHSLKTVEFRAGEGFGICGETPNYGEGPAEVYKNAEEASSRLAEIFNESVLINPC
jgi:hypothetical protein